MKRFGWYVPVVVALLLGTFLAVNLIPENRGMTSNIDNVPRQLSGFQLTSTITGQEALSSIQKMHIGSPGAIKEAIIATYSGTLNRKIELWVSDFANNEVTGTTLLATVDGIRKYPDLGFSTPEKRSLTNLDVYVSEGAGGINVFWAEENRIVYLLISNVSLVDALNITQGYMDQFG